MKKILVLLLLVSSFSAFADYRSTIIEWDAYLTRTGSDYSTAKLPAFVSSGHVYHTAVCAALKMRIYGWTDDANYAVRAVELMQAVVDHTSGISDSFFLPFPFTEAYVRIKGAGFMSPELDAALTAFAEVNFAVASINPHADDIHNQHFARAAGLAYAAQVWPNASRKDSWLSYANAFFDKVVENGDAVENAPIYDYICSFYMWHLADKIGRVDEFDNDYFHAYFTRCADYIAPSGKTPDYGDSGGVTYDPDWPMKNETAGFRVAAMYRAADFYNDPTLQWAGDKIFEMLLSREPFNVLGYTAEVPLYAMSYIDDWQKDVTPQMPEFSSRIVTKRYRTDLNDPVSYYDDKIILCPSKQAGSAYLMMDLFTPHGSHTHINQQASINYFEFGGVPLLTTNGYHGWGPESSNLCLIRDTADSFPYPVPQYRALHWYTAEVPLDNVRSFAPQGQIKFDRINLRMNNTSGGTLAGRFDNLRLAGPAGELLIDDFESLNGWSLSGIGSLINSDKTQGSNSMQIGYTANGTYFNAKSYGLTTVDTSEYTHLKIDWKYSNNTTTVRPLIFRVEATEGTCMSDFHINFLQMFTSVNKSIAAQTGDISYGSIKCDKYFTHDTKFARRMLLTGDGVLIVRDDMLPGTAAAGRNAGPIWNLSSTAQPQKGTQWVNSNGGSKELFVYMDSVNGADEYDYQTLDVNQARIAQRAAYTRKVLQAGTGERFMSVLVPHASAVAPASIASGIIITQAAAGFTGSTEVAVNNDGVVKNYKIDVLYEDETTSTVVYGDTAGMMAIKAYDKSPQSRTVGGLTFDAADVQVGYDASGQTPELKSFSAAGANYVVYEGKQLLEASSPVDVRIDYFASEVTGTIEAADGANVKIYSPVECVRLFTVNGEPVLGVYDSLTMQYEFIAGAADCEALIRSGFKLDADISGPQGKPDCVVNLWDIAELAKHWLQSLI